MATTTDWKDRYHHLMAVCRSRDEEAEFTGIAATELVVGDRVIWGGNRAFTITALWCGADGFRRVACEHGGDHLTLPLHDREEVLVLVPRPTSNPKDC